MKEITGINHVGIRVNSLDISRAFYEKLGFEFVIGPVGPEPVAIMKHPSGVIINLILNGSGSTDKNVLMDIPEKHPGYTHMALEITNLEAVQEHLKNNHISVTEGPVKTREGAAFIFVRDPDNNVVELHQPAESLGT